MGIKVTSSCSSMRSTTLNVMSTKLTYFCRIRSSISKQNLPSNTTNSTTTISQPPPMSTWDPLRNRRDSRKRTLASRQNWKKLESTTGTSLNSRRNLWPKSGTPNRISCRSGMTSMLSALKLGSTKKNYQPKITNYTNKNLSSALCSNSMKTS